VADPGWAPFLAVVAVLTLAVLGLARQSQSLIREYGPDDEAGDASEADLSDGDEPDESGGPAELNDAVPETNEALDDRESNVTPSDPGERTPAETRPTGAEPDIELTTSMLLANVAVTQGVVAAIMLVAAWYFSIPADAFGVADTAASIGFPAVALGAAFGVALWLGNELATAVADAVGAAYDEAVRRMLAPDSAGGWAVLLGVVLPIIALSEELLFRAALIGVPAAGYGVSPWLLAVVASVAFALGHGAQGRVGVVVTGALGFVLAAGYIVSGSLVLVIVAHYVINALEFLVHEGLGIDDVSFGRRIPGV
jgi:membrane protease YdiL (CAAX protease family)